MADDWAPLDWSTFKPGWGLMVVGAEGDYRLQRPGEEPRVVHLRAGEAIEVAPGETVAGPVGLTEVFTVTDISDTAGELGMGDDDG